jgi:hypothetical protein
MYNEFGLACRADVKEFLQHNSIPADRLVGKWRQISVMIFELETLMFFEL